MTYRVEIAIEALTEIDQALEWLSQQSSAAAARWHTGLRVAIDTLKTQGSPIAPLTSGCPPAPAAGRRTGAGTGGVHVFQPRDRGPTTIPR
jgi:hypothetical protein